jgi:hypothetical protein
VDSTITYLAIPKYLISYLSIGIEVGPITLKYLISYLSIEIEVGPITLTTGEGLLSTSLVEINHLPLK